MVMRVVTVKIPEELLERIDKHAKRMGRPRSDIIREALRQWLGEQERIHAKVEHIRIL